MTSGPSQKEIDGYIADLRAANKWSSAILSSERMAYLIGELQSGNPQRVAAAITAAKKIKAAHDADYNNTPRPGGEE